MADINTRLRLKKVLEETKDPVALESAKLQLNAVEQGSPGDYKQSQNVQNMYAQLQQKENKRPQGYTQSQTVTQAQQNLANLAAPGQYKPGQAVTQAQQQLQDLARPDDYNNRFDAQINSVLDTIYNRKGFDYNVGEDPAYRQYRDMYLRAGERAAADAQANAAAQTGGFANSFSQMVADQANQNYIAQLNDQIPTLMQLAYGRYQDELADNYNQLAAFQGQEQIDYGKWRDLIGDYQTDRNYLAGRYDTEYGKDYGQYRDQVGDYQTDRDYLAGRYDTEYSKDYQQYRDSVGDYESELAYLYQKYGDMSADEYQKYMNNMDLWLQDRDYYLQKYGLAQDQQNWQTEWDYATQQKTGGGGSGGSKQTASGATADVVGAALGALANLKLSGQDEYIPAPPTNNRNTQIQAARDGAYDMPHYVLEGADTGDTTRVAGKGAAPFKGVMSDAQQEEDWFEWLTPEEKEYLRQQGRYLQYK